MSSAISQSSFSTIKVIFAGLNISVGNILHPISHLCGKILGVLTPFNWLLSGVRLLVSPFVWLFTFIQISRQVTGVQRLVAFSADYLRNIDDQEAKCNLCDQIVYNVLTIDDIDPDDIDCSEICPFQFHKCMNLCQKISEVVVTATDYPCEALNMCSVDHLDDDIDYRSITGKTVKEIEDETCRLHRSILNLKEPTCQPASKCYRFIPAGGGKAKCKLKQPLMQAWGRYMKTFTRSASLYSASLISRRYCSELSDEEIAAGEICIDRPVGYAWYLDMIFYFLLFVVCAAWSVHAIETPAGDDDKHWLIFWMILLLWKTFEHLTEVVLSKHILYYVWRLIAVVILMAGGAQHAYCVIRSAMLLYLGYDPDSPLGVRWTRMKSAKKHDF